MKKPALFTVLSGILVLASATRATAAEEITGLSVEPATFSGPCPVTLNVRFTVQAKRGTQWSWNYLLNGATLASRPDLHMPADRGTSEFRDTIVLPGRGSARRDFEGNLTVVLKQLAATLASAPVHVSIRCAGPTLPPGALGSGPVIDSKAKLTVSPIPTVPGSSPPKVPMPDLVADLSAMTWSSPGLVVRNIGTAGSGPSHALLQCRASRGGTAGTAGGCPAALTANPAFDPGLDGLVFSVPAIAAGGSHPVAVPFWSALVFAPGEYKFAARADARAEVAEANEANNTATAALTK